MLSPELGPRGGQFDSDFSFFPSPSLPMHPHFPRPSKMDRMLHLLLLQNCCLHCSKQVNCPHLTVYPNESSPEKEESRYTSRTSSEEEGSTRKTSHTYRLQKRIQHLTPSRRRCPYGHPENHFRSYSAKSSVLKLSAHMRALTASKDQYKLKSPQHLCVNLNIFVTVVP